MYSYRMEDIPIKMGGVGGLRCWFVSCAHLPSDVTPMIIDGAHASPSREPGLRTPAGRKPNARIASRMLSVSCTLMRLACLLADEALNFGKNRAPASGVLSRKMLQSPCVLSRKMLTADRPNSKQQTGATVAGNIAWLGAGSVTWRAGVEAAESGYAVDGAKLEAELAALLPTAAAARGFVRACLRAKRYQLDKAQSLACNYIAFRERVGWHGPGAVCAAAVAPALRSGFNTLLTARDRYGHVVLTQSMHRFDPANGTLEAHQRSGYYLLHRALQRPGAQTNGIALLLDFRGFGIRLFSRFGSADVARGVAILQDCFPARVAVLYVLHEPRFLKSVFTLLRPFLKADSLSTKFVLVGSEYSRLYEHLPCEAVPEAILAGGPADDAWCALVDSWMAEEAATDEDDRHPGLAQLIPMCYL